MTSEILEEDNKILEKPLIFSSLLEICVPKIFTPKLLFIRLCYILLCYFQTRMNLLFRISKITSQYFLKDIPMFSTSFPDSNSIPPVIKWVHLPARKWDDAFFIKYHKLSQSYSILTSRGLVGVRVSNSQQEIEVVFANSTCNLWKFY